MRIPASSVSNPHIRQLSFTAVLLAVLFFLAFSACLAADQAGKTAADDGDDESGGWIFDQSTYTSDSKTGRRVDQYKKERTPYRDPNALFDSPMLFFPSNGWSFDNFDSFYSAFYYFGAMHELYGQYYFGEDGSAYYPYDGDPNDEDDSDASEAQMPTHK